MNIAQSRSRGPRRLGGGTFAAALVAIVLSVGSVATTVAAQAGTHDLARRLVAEGIEAAKSNDWATARDQFQKAYDIKPVPQTLYNLAAAQEKTGLLVEADRSYRLYLRETEVGGNAQFRKLASQRRAELVRRIAHVTINVENLGPDDTLLVNEKEISTAVVGESIPVNPGWNKLLVRRDGADVAGQNVQLAEGASQVVALAAPAYVAPAIAPATTTSATGGRSTAGGAAPASASNGAGASEAEDEGGGFLVPAILGGGALVVVGVLAAGAGTAAALLLIPGEPTETSLDAVTINGL